MCDEFWAWFEKHIDGQFLNRDKYVELLTTLQKIDSTVQVKVGDGWTGRDSSGKIVSKQQLIFIGNKEIVSLTGLAPILKTWEIVAQKKSWFW
jgi:hypothetical protein